MSFDELVLLVDRAAQGLLGDGMVTYQPEFGAPVDVPGIFDKQYVLAQGDPLAGVETIGPAVFFRIDDLPTDPEEDDPTIVIGSDRYRVVERRPDGMGGIVLALRLVT
jgi:hypothetical protein